MDITLYRMYLTIQPTNLVEMYLIDMKAEIQDNYSENLIQIAK